MSPLIWCKCSLCTTTTGVGTRQTVQTAKRHSDADSQRALPSQAALLGSIDRSASTTGALPQYVYRDLRSVCENTSTTRKKNGTVPRASSQLGKTQESEEESKNPNTNHEGHLYDDFFQPYSSDDDSDFGHEPRLDDSRPRTPEESSSDDESVEDSTGASLQNDLVDDPLFIPRGLLFNPYQLGGIEGDDEEVDPLEDIHPAIVNAYVRAFISAAFNSATNAAVALSLDGSKLLLESAQRLAPQLNFPGLSNFARTLLTVERRLGLSTTDFITYYILCD